MSDESHPNPITTDFVGLSGTQAVIDNARATADPKTLDPQSAQALVIPAGATAYLPDLSAWRNAPFRRTGTYRPATVQALIDYVNWQNIEDQTTIWVHPSSGKVEAILDDNGDESPGYRQHRAHLQLQPTPEWTYWLAKDKVMMSQEDFAFHVESGLMEITVPDAVDLLELAQSFHAADKATFRSSTRLASGEVQFQYDQELEAKAGRTGQIQVPQFIELLVSPFVGEDAVRLVARFRYRLSGGSLTLGYQVERPDYVIREVLDGIAGRLSDEFARVFVGEAPGV